MQCWINKTSLWYPWLISKSYQKYQKTQWMLSKKGKGFQRYQKCMGNSRSHKIPSSRNFEFKRPQRQEASYLEGTHYFNRRCIRSKNWPAISEHVGVSLLFYTLSKLVVSLGAISLGAKTFSCFLVEKFISATYAFPTRLNWTALASAPEKFPWQYFQV